MQCAMVRWNMRRLEAFERWGELLIDSVLYNVPAFRAAPGTPGQENRPYLGLIREKR
jgi:hypothetical protein